MDYTDNIRHKALEVINTSTNYTNIYQDKYDDDLFSLGMDSITFINIVVSLEENFGIEIPDEYLLPQKMDTINKIVNIIEMILSYDKKI